MKKSRSPEELELKTLTITLKSHILADLKKMENNTKQPVDELVSKALMMFIATHSDYLGRQKN